MSENVVIPVASFRKPSSRFIASDAPSLTPVTDSIFQEAKVLDNTSSYKSDFDYTIYSDLERRFSQKEIKGGFVFRSPFRLVNSHHTCQQCLYSFEVDTYGRGCIHDCVYCYAKAELTVHGYWNKPIPVPVDINQIRKIFYTVFETSKRSKWRQILERKIPLRIGSMSDAFMFMDKKFKVTQELLKILKFYNYPHIIFTRSDLVSSDEYLKLLDPNLAAVQMSLSSVNDHLNRLIEPAAPSAERRLDALKILSKRGIWTTARINPLFPIYPDGYFTDKSFTWNGEVPKFEYSDFNMVDVISDYNVPSILVGFARLSSFALNNIERVTGFNLRQFYRKNLVNKSPRDWHYSDAEIRYYYEKFYLRCKRRGIQFTTCYIGNGESHFWEHQDLWSNRIDCCNVKSRIQTFKTDAREIPFDERLRLANNKCATPTSDRLHVELTP